MIKDRTEFIDDDVRDEDYGDYIILMIVKIMMCFTLMMIVDNTASC